MQFLLSILNYQTIYTGYVRLGVTQFTDLFVLQIDLTVDTPVLRRYTLQHQTQPLRAMQNVFVKKMQNIMNKVKKFFEHGNVGNYC